jgi:ADP-heptose:LPS heptosyltransferase
VVTVLEDVAFRVDGLRVLERASRSRDDVVLDLSACSLAEGLWALPALDAIAAQLPAARLAVLAGDGLAELLVAHLRSQRCQVVRVGTGARTSTPFRIELSPRPTTRPRLSRTGDHLRVPSRPFPKRVQHAWGHWVDGARACGFDARAARPRLLLEDRDAARAARRWLRERFGRRGRTLIALLPSPSPARPDRSWDKGRFARVGRDLATRLDASLLCHGSDLPGAIALDDLDIVTTAHVLAFVAVAIGDADGVVHLAAAAGAPAVSLHGDASVDECGAASELGAAVSADRCRCPSPRAGCLACIAPERVADVAERLAGRRWPWDRLAQVGLVRPLAASSPRASPWYV